MKRSPFGEDVIPRPDARFPRARPQRRGLARATNGAHRWAASLAGQERAMALYAYERVNVFTGERFGGNTLAVVTDARGLTDAQMQAVARDFNLSETTFVL